MIDEMSEFEDIEKEIDDDAAGAVCFVHLPEWHQRTLTSRMPMLENCLNALKAARMRAAAMVEDIQIINQGIQFCIQRYGLRVRPGSDDAEAGPSTSRAGSGPSQPKRIKLEENAEDVLTSALESAISERGIGAV